MDPKTGAIRKVRLEAVCLSRRKQSLESDSSGTEDGNKISLKSSVHLSTPKETVTECSTEDSRKPSRIHLPNCIHIENRRELEDEIIVDFNHLFENSQRTRRVRVSDNREAVNREDCDKMEDRNIIDEFCRQLDKTREQFIAIRELPEYAVKDWSSHFRRVFEDYAFIWKYQQQHRELLLAKYGLKRWQIGEIASKIGQLYYFYYQRTSNLEFLEDAYGFYSTIRDRSYYTRAIKEDRCELMIKKLRFYSRFIVVCLLQRKLKIARDLVKELDRQIMEYGNAYNTEDQVDWVNTSDDVKAFLASEAVVDVIHPDNHPVTLTHRMTPSIVPPIERSSQMNLSLQEIVIVGSSAAQLKVNELSMDIYKMIQTLERQPEKGDFHYTPLCDSPPQLRRYDPMERAQHRDRLDYDCSRAHKYVLFMPTLGQVLTHISSGFSEMPTHGVLLLYMSADGYYSQPLKNLDREEAMGYDVGGLLLTPPIKNHHRRSTPHSSGKNREKQYLCATDMMPFTRKPMLIILDSDNSFSFQHVPRRYGQPLVVLMSPVELPAAFQERRRKGNLFTLFLHSPLTAFCYICELTEVKLQIWERAQSLLEQYMAEASAIFVRSRVDSSYIAFMGDDFMRLLILRFVLCETVLRLHRAFRSRNQRTRCSPPLPEELYDHPNLIHILTDLASLLQVRNFFQDAGNVAGPSTSY